MMNVRVAKTFPRLLPADDDHPYRTGAHRPTLTEFDATDLDLVAGELPRDLEGVYLRNTENPVLPSLGRYHPFDGDGMIHAVHFHDGRADYRNRFVRTEGLQEELAVGEPLWAGIVETPAMSKRDGWGARTRLKDAGSTDVSVHNGTAIATFYQCGDAYQLDPVTLDDRGPATWARDKALGKLGVSAHPKNDPRTGELLFFNYGTKPPYFHVGTLDAKGKLVHHAPVSLPGPRLPHDIAFTERYFVVNDLPLFWDPTLMAKGVYRARFMRDLPSRFALVPRHGDTSPIRWFEAAPTYVLHWVNAYEEGDEVILEGFHQSNPTPKAQPNDTGYDVLQRTLDMHQFESRLHRWRFNLKDGTTREERLDERCSEFPMIHASFAGVRHRFTYAMVGEPGGFLFSGLVRYDGQTGAVQRHAFPKGVFASESPMAPRTGSTTEDDGYLVTFVSDVVSDTSECQVFDARDIARGPIARLKLPERIASGTHACWAPKAWLGEGV